MMLDELATVRVLVIRELKRFFRQKSRIAGALMQPLIFWAVLGLGLANTFQLAGSPQAAATPNGISYLQYFFPGVIGMMVLFTALFSTMSLIEDRASGFLQAVMVAPSSRTSMVVGKVLGGVSVALIQVTLFICLFPLAGFTFGQIAWVKLYSFLFLTAFGLNALGFYLAWWLNSVQGYHAIMSVLLIPLWLISGAMFPIKGSAWPLRVLMNFNPMTYSVEGIRSAFYGKMLPGVMGPRFNSVYLQMAVVLVFAALFFTLAIRRCRQSQV